MTVRPADLMTEPLPLCHMRQWRQENLCFSRDEDQFEGHHQSSFSLQLVPEICWREKETDVI